MEYPMCSCCNGDGAIAVENGQLQTCRECNGTGVMMSDQDRRAWAEDEKDMARIKREWDAFDRDPPGS